MRIVIGLSTALPGIDGPALLDPLTALAAAAAVITRITLATTVLLAPLHTNHVGFVNQAASRDRLATGRLLRRRSPQALQ